MPLPFYKTRTSRAGLLFWGWIAGTLLGIISSVKPQPAVETPVSLAFVTGMYLVLIRPRPDFAEPPLRAKVCQGGCLGLLRFRWPRREEIPAVPATLPEGRPPETGPQQTHRFIAALFVIAAFLVLYVARSFFMPVALALLFALILSPPVQALAERKVPCALGAMLVLAAFLGWLALAGFLLAGPVSTWLIRGPEAFARVSKKVEPVARPFHRMKDAFKTSAPKPSEPPREKVEVEQPGMLTSTLSRTGAFVSVAGTAFVLLYFFLASGDALLTSILRGISSVDRRERLVAIAQDIKRHISKYLFAITIVNVAEGGLIALGTALAGMPTPLLWGALHALLNFIPYLGAITGLAITTLAAMAVFDSLTRILIPPAIYIAVMVLDNFVGPLFLGKRLVLNPALVFLSLMFWGWLWGIVGILIALPILITLKIICDHVPELNRFGRIISADKPVDLPA